MPKRKNDFPYAVGKGIWHKLHIGLLRDPDLRSLSDLAYRIYFELLSDWNPMDSGKPNPDEITISLDVLRSRIPPTRRGKNPHPNSKKGNKNRDRRAVQGAVKELILAGFISKKGNRGGNRANTYTIDREPITRLKQR